MQRVFYVLGLIFVGITIAIAGLMGFVAYRGSALDAESEAYVDQAVVDVGKNWNSTELLKRASPDLLKRVSAEQITALFQQLAKFGDLIHFDGAKGQATMSVSIVGDTAVRAHYEGNATFKNGPAHFRIDLSKHNERWMIDGFFVDVTPFITAPAAKPI